jgi:hypothetical protein
VRKDGFAPKRIDDPKFPETVVLTRGPSVTVRFPAPLPAPAGAQGFRFWLSTPRTRSETGSGGPPDEAFFLRGGQQSSTQVKPGARAVTFEDINPGIYTLRARPDRQGEGPLPPRGRGGRGGDGIDLGLIEILAGEGEQVIDLSIDAASFVSKLGSVQ